MVGVVVHYAVFGGASVRASRLVSSLAPPNCTSTYDFGSLPTRHAESCFT